MVLSPLLGLKNPNFRPMHQVIGNAVAFRYFAAQQKRAFILPILQDDGASAVELVSGQPAYGPGKAAPNPVLEASRTFPVLWRSLQYAGNGGGTLPRRACVAVLAQSTQQQKGAELGAIQSLEDSYAVANIQDRPYCLSACEVAK